MILLTRNVCLPLGISQECQLFPKHQYSTLKTLIIHMRKYIAIGPLLVITMMQNVTAIAGVLECPQAKVIGNYLSWRLPLVTQISDKKYYYRILNMYPLICQKHKRINKDTTTRSYMLSTI